MQVAGESFATSAEMNAAAMGLPMKDRSSVAEASFFGRDHSWLLQWIFYRCAPAEQISRAMRWLAFSAAK
jgi:hypothetical protein